MENVRTWIGSIMLEVLVGTLGTFAAGAGCGLLFYAGAWLLRIEGWNWVSWALWAMVGSATIGAAAGVIITGRWLKVKGSVAEALLGAIGGLIVASAIIVNGSQELGVLGTLFAAFLPIGAIVGYNLRRWLTARENQEK